MAMVPLVLLQVMIADEIMAEHRIQSDQSVWHPPDSGLMKAATNARRSMQPAANSSSSHARRLGRRQRRPGSPPLGYSASAEFDDDVVSESDDCELQGYHAQAIHASQPWAVETSQSSSLPRSPIPQSLKSSPNLVQQAAHPNQVAVRPQRSSLAASRPVELPSFAERKIPPEAGAAIAQQVAMQHPSGREQTPVMKPNYGAPRQGANSSAPRSPLPPTPSQSSTVQPSVTAGVDVESPQSFWMQVQRVNQLSSDLEAALLTLKALSRDDHKPNASEGTEPHQLKWNADTAVVPYVQPELDAYVLRVRAVDLEHGQPVAQPYQQLSSPSGGDRYTSVPSPPASPAPQAAFPPVVPATALDPPVSQHYAGRSSSSRRGRHDWFLRLILPPTTPLGILNDALSWIAGAVLARVGLELLQLVHPALWTVALLLMLAALVFGSYRALLEVKSKPILAYRLVLLIVGLVFGGRLWSR
ncbi:MAG: hypothetical protein NZ772_05180 [Cyanobacteria bacterium]|nr:hypothetical protein [Cyanobacteriota bacterium]MDW8200883.1 hypothetical protein [Cyanobacteriota bacterium SKYGB_h_bin112]